MTVTYILSGITCIVAYIVRFKSLPEKLMFINGGEIGCYTLSSLLHLNNTHKTHNSDNTSRKRTPRNQIINSNSDPEILLL